MSSEKVFILIVTYNAEAWLSTCCQAFGSLPPGWELLVVDNNSTDNTIQLARQKYPHARLIENRENLGFGRANNMGLRIALDEEAAYVLLLNQDAAISLSAIEELIALHKRHPECLVLSPVQLTGSGKDLDYGFFACITPQASPGLCYDALITGSVKELYHSKQGVAAAWLLSREALTVVGGFNPLFYHYGEDEDYVNRILYHGRQLGVATGVYARHHRENRPRVKKAVGTRFIDKLICMADPSRPAPSCTAIFLSYLPAICRQALAGRFSLALYLCACCWNLVCGGEDSYRAASKKKGTTFL